MSDNTTPTPTDKAKTCDCWKNVNAKLSEHGVQLSEKHRTLGVPDFEVRYVLLLEGKTVKLKRGMPATITMSFCPFCGQKYNQA